MTANFTPNMSSIKDMKPFRFWCQKVLPTVYDDSLSYYELLNKVVNYLNETVDNVDLLNDNVTRLYDAYVLLESYVNNFFEQNFPPMVEAKLDEMAEDGTLTALIAEYIDPLFLAKSEEIDAKFLEQDNDIDNALETANLTSARMDNFINQHSGLSSETVLYDGEGTPAYTVGSYLSLSDAIADYKYLRIVWIHRQEICVQDFAIDNTITGQNFNLRDTLGVPGSNPPTSKLWEMCQITLIDATSDGDNKLEIGTATVIDNLDYADGNVDNTMHTGVLKVIGIKDVADTEVVDARVGADGTTYTNLEERLNTDYATLLGAISQGDIPTTIKTSIDRILQNVAFKNDDIYTSDLAVIHNWATSVELISITAVYNQSAPVYENQSLNTLKTDLTVTAHYANGTTETVTDSAYTLSGTLTVGTSTITVNYSGKTTTFNVTVSSVTREMLFGVFSDGYAIAKQTGGNYPEYQPFAYRQATTARATTPTPFTNNNYIFTVTDSTKYNIAVYDVENMTELSIPAITQAVDGVGYHCGSKTVAWATQDSATTAYAWIALKKMDGTAFTTEELANGAEAVFTYSVGS